MTRNSSGALRDRSTAKRGVRGVGRGPTRLQEARQAERATKRARAQPRGAEGVASPQQALLAENPHDHGGDDHREEPAKPPEAIRAHHAPPPLRDCPQERAASSKPW